MKSRKPQFSRAQSIPPGPPISSPLSRAAGGGESASVTGSSLRYAETDRHELLALLELLPPAVRDPVLAQPEFSDLIEIVLDVGRRPLARLPSGDIELGSWLVDAETLGQASELIGPFDADNRAGVVGTLHRISALRNRSGRVVGLTFRRGRAIYGQVRMIRDLIESRRSTLLVGRPGVGKTTLLREISRELADSAGRRVLIVDTSNEIAGDGDIPHPGIGSGAADAGSGSRPPTPSDDRSGRKPHARGPSNR